MLTAFAAGTSGDWDKTPADLGRALWIWNHFLGNEMVTTTGSADVRCFASRKVDQQLTVFLLNKDTSAREVAVALQHSPGEFTRGEQWVFHGSGPSDQHPTWERVGAIPVADSRMALRLDPFSVTGISLKPPMGSGSTASSCREVISLDFDWRFHRGDIPTALTEKPLRRCCLDRNS